MWIKQIQNLISDSFIIPCVFQGQDSQCGRGQMCEMERKSGRNPEVSESEPAALTPETHYPCAEEAWERWLPASSECAGTAIARSQKAELLGEEADSRSGTGKEHKSRECLVVLESKAATEDSPGQGGRTRA